MENSQNLSLGYSTNKWKRGTVKFLCIKLMPANTGWTSVFILKPPAWESDECREMLVCICVKMSLSILCVPSTAKKQVRRYLNWLENSVMTKVILHLLWRAWLKTLGMFAAGCSSPVISINNPPLYRHEDDVGVGNVPEATPKRTDTQSNLFHLELYWCSE